MGRADAHACARDLDGGRPCHRRRPAHVDAPSQRHHGRRDARGAAEGRRPHRRRPGDDRLDQRGDQPARGLPKCTRGRGGPARHRAGHARPPHPCLPGGRRTHDRTRQSQVVDAVRDVLRAVHDHARQHDRERRAADHPARARRVAGQPRVDRERLRGDVRRADPARRQARRPVRAQAHVHGRRRPVHDLLGACAPWPTPTRS